MKKDKKEEGENFLLKKIRYYQGTISDFETFWNDKISQEEKEHSQETKNCKVANANLNKAYEIVPVTRDDDNEPKPLSKDEVEKEEKKVKKNKKDKKDDKEV